MLTLSRSDIVTPFVKLLQEGHFDFHFVLLNLYPCRGNCLFSSPSFAILLVSESKLSQVSEREVNQFFIPACCCLMTIMFYCLVFKARYRDRNLKRSPCRVYPFELYLNLFLMCAWLCFYFLSLFCVICCACVFLFFVRACLYHCDVYSADVGLILYINGYYFIFLAYTNVCSVTELT